MGSDKRNELLDALDEYSEKESGVTEEEKYSESDDLDEDVENRQERKIELPFGDDSEEKSPSGLNADDLVDDLVEAEADEDELPEISKNSADSFATSKKMNKSKKTMQGVVVIAGAVLLLIIFLVPSGKKEKKVAAEEDQGRINTEKILQEMKSYSGDDLRKKQQRTAIKTMVDTPINSEVPGKKAEQSSENSANSGAERSGEHREVKRRSSGGGYSKNTEKDRDILDKYANINPEAAAEGGTGSQQRLMNVPARSGQGGLNIISSKSDEVKKASYYNLELKAVLSFGVRSSSGTNVVATVKESKGIFSEGAIFYGTASFNNKRTFVQFTHAIVDDKKIELEGNAMMGKDPGIPSEVSEIASENANSSLKAGVLGATGTVADNALARVTGGATAGVLQNPTADLQEQQEQQKKQYEYFVPAKTVFTIYVY